MDSGNYVPILWAIINKTMKDKHQHILWYSVVYNYALYKEATDNVCFEYHVTLFLSMKMPPFPQNLDLIKMHFNFDKMSENY